MLWSLQLLEWTISLIGTKAKVKLPGTGMGTFMWILNAIAVSKVLNKKLVETRTQSDPTDCTSIHLHESFSFSFFFATIPSKTHSKDIFGLWTSIHYVLQRAVSDFSIREILEYDLRLKALPQPSIKLGLLHLTLRACITTTQLHFIVLMTRAQVTIISFWMRRLKDSKGLWFAYCHRAKQQLGFDLTIVKLQSLKL